jgi:hypothetical protein
VEQVMAERDKKALKAQDGTGRLGSLAASLASLMDWQEMLMQSHNKKDAQLVMEASLACHEYLTKLFELEQDFMEQVMNLALLVQATGTIILGLSIHRPNPPGTSS